MSEHKKYQLKAQILVVSRRSLYASTEDGDAQIRPNSSTREDLSIDVSITNVYRTDIDKAIVISFLEVQTDGQTDGQTRFPNPHMATCRYAQNFMSKFKIRS